MSAPRVEVVKAALTVRTTSLQIDALAAHVLAPRLVLLVPAPDRAELADQIPDGVMDGRLPVIRAALKMRGCVEVGAVVGQQRDGHENLIVSDRANICAISLAVP